MFPKFDREKGNPLTIIPSSGGRLLEPYEKIMKVVIKILGKHNIPMIVNASAKEGIDSLWLSNYGNVIAYSGAPYEFKIIKSNLECFTLKNEIELKNEYFGVKSKDADILFINPDWSDFGDVITRRTTGLNAKCDEKECKMDVSIREHFPIQWISIQLNL